MYREIGKLNYWYCGKIIIFTVHSRIVLESCLYKIKKNSREVFIPFYRLALPRANLLCLVRVAKYFSVGTVFNKKKWKKKETHEQRKRNFRKNNAPIVVKMNKQLLTFALILSSVLAYMSDCELLCCCITIYAYSKFSKQCEGICQ